VGTLRQFGGRELTLMGLLLTGAGWWQVAEAQVDLRSAPVQVALVARAAPHGTIRTPGYMRWTTLADGARAGTHVLRLSANTRYSLVVRGVQQPVRGSRTWVRAANGKFQEVTSGSSVTVARGRYGGVELEHPIHYRIESAASGEPAQLPVIYELRIAPTL
jgi:hypothetical protein